MKQLNRLKIIKKNEDLKNSNQEILNEKKKQ